MIKYLITGGCSFSTYTDKDNWTGHLERELQNIYPILTANHTGYNSQGQELIQKKVTLAILEALDNGYTPDEILVTVMWSGTYRKAWYIDNKKVIERMVEMWPTFKGGMCSQFLDLKNEGPKIPTYFKTAYGNDFLYNPEGGWYYTVNGSDCKMEFVQQHYELDGWMNGGVGKVHISLENIVMLQNFCRLYNIKLVNQFFMDHVYQDFVDNKDHQIIQYLFRQLDKNMITDGMFEYLHKYLLIERHEAGQLTHEQRRKLDDGRNIFNKDGFHPGSMGSKLWCDNVLVPFIKNNYLGE